MNIFVLTKINRVSKPSMPWRTASVFPASIELWMTATMAGREVWKAACRCSGEILASFASYGTETYDLTLLVRLEILGEHNQRAFDSPLMSIA